MSHGRVTLPIQTGMDDQLRPVLERLGADAVRNSDGTWLPAMVEELGAKVYATYFVARGDQEWGSAHPQERTQLYLLTPRVPALADGELVIEVMAGLLADQVTPDTSDVARWWEVRDRTSGEVVPPSEWSVTGEGAQCRVTLTGARAGHVYTVAFLAWQQWDSTQMYNYLTNGWADDPTRCKEIPYDARRPATWDHMRASLRTWLAENPQVDVVRFTTFFYHFTLVFNDRARESFVDWFGYSASVSVPAMEAFEAARGYALTPEDFVDEGYFNSPFRPPRQAFVDWVDFQHEFVTDHVRELVEIVHEAGREAIMFLGDNWIGTEPYGPRFPGTGLDGVAGSVGSAATCRMISDIPGVRWTEGRFLPYFFPDVFNPEGDPVGEAEACWLQARRAIVRSPLDRIGWGGYLSLALEFDDFVARIAEIADEFREIHDRSAGELPAGVGVRVGVLNAWGKLRSWQTHMVAHALPYEETTPHVGVLEALAGLPVEVEFLSFDDVRDGVPDGVDVLLNVGGAATAFSGGDAWRDPALQASVRAFVARGGGLIGVGEPTAAPGDGAIFQLSDVLGVDRELGWSLSTDRYPTLVADHPVLPADAGTLDVGASPVAVVPVAATTQVLRWERHAVRLSVNTYGAGRAAYVAGLPYGPENARLLLRMLCWTAGKEESLASSWLADSPWVETAHYPEAGLLLAFNDSGRETIRTTLRGPGRTQDVELAPGGYAWLDLEEER